ncbi:MAG: tyrosine-type recombinase/integrase [Opitutales bacterium]|jgi:integrase/recombinase XerD
MKNVLTEWETLLARHRQALLIHGYSPRTLATIATYGRRWGEFAQETKLTTPQAVTAAAVSSFQAWLWHAPTIKQATRSIAGQNNVLSYIKTFFLWLQAEGVIGRNPTAALRLAKQPDPLPKDVLTPKEAARILDAPNLRTAFGRRDRAILEVMYATGLRRAELRALDVADADLETGVLTVRRGKGGKGRVVPLTRTAGRCLEAYLRISRPSLLAGHASPRLFVSSALYPGLDMGLGEHALGNLVKRYAVAAGIKKKVTPHLWRHTCATHLLRNNANLRHVQELLGHRSLATTERYLRLTITDLKEAHRRHHPREKNHR